MGTFNINTIQAGGGRSLANVQIFIAPGTWEKPDNVDYIYMEVIGAGGGGGHGSGPNPNPGGRQGGCGGFGIGYMEVTNLNPTSVPITVGVGGFGGSPPAQVPTPYPNATDGTGSSFGTYLVATYGTAGESGPPGINPGVTGSASGPAMVWDNSTLIASPLVAPYGQMTTRSSATAPTSREYGSNHGLGSMNFGLTSDQNMSGIGGAQGMGGFQPAPVGNPPGAMAGQTGGHGQVRVWGYSS